MKRICSYEDNFSLRSIKKDKGFVSSNFTAGKKDKSDWSLSVYLNGFNEDTKEYVSVLLKLNKSLRTRESVKFKISILNDKNEEKNVHDRDVVLTSTQGRSGGYPKFIKRDFLLCKNNGLLINNEFTILLELSVVDELANHNYPRTPTSNRVAQLRFSLDIKNTFDSSILIDCIIKVKDTEINVHKAILAARSPVFYDIFNSTSEESQKMLLK
uniref:BTB domain-containing protein n=1 Tax=Strongyloides papillosus TaxID=174720 RepID=A0A0N5C013_STREA